eukprot:TRINITY_DN4627_c0_g1_i1.p2 TRINITY_DN4627_c0_g1~~TRINITY_DN4627_c0_g1_i1.p2  ORF type:complete len:252 (+),score=69.58 TRINITY_DN4627_c0_g1_i1:39-794(+)
MALEAKMRETHGDELDEVADIDELNIDELITTEKLSEVDKKFLERFTTLSGLSMNKIGLTSLENLPALPELNSIQLADNSIAGKLGPLANYPMLQQIVLDGNPIPSAKELEPLKSLKELASLSLIDCPVASTPTYREDIFKMIPSLQILDDLDKDGKEINIEADEDESGESEGEIIEGEDESEEALEGEEVSEADEDEIEVKGAKRGNSTKPTGKNIEEDEEEDSESEEEVRPPKKAKKQSTPTLLSLIHI